MIKLENLQAYKSEVVNEKTILETELEIKLNEIKALYEKDILKLDGKLEMINQLIEEYEDEELL